VNSAVASRWKKLYSRATVATEVNARGAYVKIRHPWGAFLLVIVTLGIYYLFWYYFINRELRDFGRVSAGSEANRIDVNPWISLLAVTFGWLLIIPPFVSMYRTFRRIRTAQEIADVGPKASPGIGLLLFFIALIFFPVEVPYAQTNLNRVWRPFASVGQAPSN
jgi:hypothetical protein